MLTRITDRKILCAFIHVYCITKNWGPGPYNSLCHADNSRYFSTKGSTHVLLSERSGKIWICSCWEKGNFIIINEFKYGQTWKVWPSHLVYHFTVYTFKKVNLIFSFEPSMGLCQRTKLSKTKGVWN